MRVLTLLVVVMGVVIVAAVTLLGVKMVGGAAHPATGFAALPIDLPKGARIETMAAGSDRLVLAVALADGSRELIVLDLASGRQLGLVPLREAP